MNKTTSPLRIICRNCGHPVTFNIELQTYCCPMCGETTGIEETKQEALRLHELHKESLYAQNAQLQATTCSGCGAKLVFPPGEALTNCDFCGGRLVRSDAEKQGFTPDLVIPFVLTEEEAKMRLREWAANHPKTAEARMIDSSSDDLQGYYLPYELVQGPMEVKVNRAGLSRNYMCRGFVEKTAVNCVREMDYSILDAVEPFDFGLAEPFEYGYVSGHRAMLCNISDNDIDRRARRQVARTYLPTIQKALQDSDLRIKVTSEQLLSASAMLPVYILKKGRLSAVVNGQTGRVAVSLKDKEKKPFPFWAVEAAAYTVAVTLLLCSIFSFEWRYVSLFGIFFGAMFFVGMGYDRAPIATRIIKRSKKTKAHRENGELFISQDEAWAQTCPPPVFYENIDGRNVPVEYKFLPLRRILSLLLQSIVLIFAPVVVAAIIAAIKAFAESGNLSLSGFGINLRAGSIWFIFTVTYSFLFLIQAARFKAFDRPFIYERTQDGNRKLVGNPRERRLTLFNLFFTDTGNAVTEMKSKKGIFFIISTAFIFILSIWSMLAF